MPHQTISPCSLRGYLTKYDCSSGKMLGVLYLMSFGTDRPVADVNPIGAISKTDLKRFIAYARDAFELPILEECVVCPSGRSSYA